MAAGLSPTETAIAIAETETIAVITKLIILFLPLKPQISTFLILSIKSPKTNSRAVSIAQSMYGFSDGALQLLSLSALIAENPFETNVPERINASLLSIGRLRYDSTRPKGERAMLISWLWLVDG